MAGSEDFIVRAHSGIFFHKTARWLVLGSLTIKPDEWYGSRNFGSALRYRWQMASHTSTFQ